MDRFILPLIFAALIIGYLVYKERVSGLTSDALSFKHKEIDLNSLKAYDETFIKTFYQSLTPVGMRTSAITNYLSRYYDGAVQYVRNKSLDDYMKYIIQYDRFDGYVRVDRAYRWFYIDSFLRTQDRYPAINYNEFRRGLKLLGFNAFINDFEQRYSIVYNEYHTDVPDKAISQLVTSYQNGTMFEKGE